MNLELIIAKRWPNRMLEIRKRSSTDPEFRQILSDYCEATDALIRWRSIDPAASGRVADYERLVCELESEINKRLA
ncbi:hypothetical protein [uncultured Ruegeria sp.]|uniref:hypothetical protein n=1 Tax=uncultured Ruegeria sp. TaxID=259304 RepID=UPI00262AD6DF|nr:hypothetical protein [uncultured Ruegeria sp.]